MKVYDTATSGAIVKFTEKDIILLTTATQLFQDLSNSSLEIEHCIELISGLEKAVYDGTSNKERPCRRYRGSYIAGYGGRS